MTLIVSPPPYTLLNGTIADATQVMADLLATISQVNANAAHNGVNSDITALTGLTTALTPSQGGSVVFSASTTTGTANAQASAATVPSGYTQTMGYGVLVQAGLSNGAAMTLNVAGTGDTAVKKYLSDGSLVDLSAGDWISGNSYLLNFDGTQYIVLNPTLSASGSIHGIPVGGSTGQVLTKRSNSDYDVDWETVSGGGVTGASAFTSFFTSADLTFTNGTLVTQAHGLGATPDFATCVLVCQTADHGYSPGDIIPISSFWASQSGGRAFYFDDTNMYFFHRANNYGDAITSATATAASVGFYNINAANWKVRFTGAIIGGGTVSSGLPVVHSGSIDTSVGNGLIDLRSYVPNDTTVKIFIEIYNLKSTGADGSTFTMTVKFAQQGTVNPSNNYGSSPLSGWDSFSGQMNQAPVTVMHGPAAATDITQGSGTLELNNFCRTSGDQPWVDSLIIGKIFDATVANQVAYGNHTQIWGSGGDDSKVTDGIAFEPNGHATKWTFDYRILVQPT